MEPPQVSRDFALYNGVSNRSRGWKSRKPGESTEPRAARHIGIKRWDGNAKTSTAWDGLRRDPELWFRNGNCFVHLYAQGQSRRGPAFKLPFSTLLAAQCHSMVERFIARDMPTLSSASDRHDSTMLQPMPTPLPLATLDYWSRAHLLGRVDLYIPPPLEANRDQVYSYYLAIRNLFAWIFRRPVVGEHLGSALAGLFSAMREFRQANVDNASDLMCYLEDEGYLALAGQPEYALALLHLSETMHMRDLYVTAFAHCVGMYNELFMGTEHQYVSAVSRKLIRRARLDMDLRLGSAGAMLCNFLEDELSETHLGLPAQSRTHLNRFRTFLQGYYAARLGGYPPMSIDARSTIFEPRVYRLLAEDFQALYEYLVDTSFLAGSTAPPLSQGGFCVLQNINDFDARHRYAPQKHPLPLLPETRVQPPITSPTNTATNMDTASSGFLGVPTPKRSLSTRRMSWFGSKKMDKLLPSRSEKLTPDTRLVANASLLKATNKLLPETAHSDFVHAYRQFEEDSVFKPYKADRMEKIALVEARKVRWILVYAIHQTLQNCFVPPPLQITDAATVRYHMSISPKHIPEWKAGAADTYSPPVSPTSAALPSLQTWTNAYTFPATEHLMPAPLAYAGRSKTLNISLNSPAPPPDRSMSMTALPDGHRRSTILMMPDRVRSASPVFDIRPDIDYLGLANRAETSGLNGAVEVVMLPRSRSLSRTLSQKAAFRRSLSLFRGNSSSNTYTQNQEPPSPKSSPSPSPPRSSRGKKTENGADSKSEPTSLHSSFRSKRNSLLMRPSAQAKTEEKDKTHDRKIPPYHEIVVHGYGNGTNPVRLTVSTDVAAAPRQESKEAAEEGASPSTPLDDSATTPSTARSLSTSSTTSNTSAATAETALTALSEATPTPVCPIACPGVTGLGSAADVTAMPDVNWSSNMYSGSTPGSSVAIARTDSFVVAEAPAIPPRGGPPSHDVSQKPGMPLSASVSRSSSVYSTASMLDDVLAAGGNRLAAASMPSPSLGALRRTPPLQPPPLPVRSSARHRRFSVYGGGDEYALLNYNMDALHALGAAGLQRSNTTARFTSMLSGSQRQDAQPPMPAPPQTQIQRRSSLHSATGSSHRPQSLYVGAAAPGGQRFDMVQEALEAVRETMDQHQMGPSTAVSRTPSFVGVAALRSVNEDDELAMGVPSTGGRRRSKTRTQPRRLRYRRSSYAGPRDDSNIDSHDDNEDYDIFMDCPRRGPVQSEHPEWDKFATLGGLTVV